MEDRLKLTATVGKTLVGQKVGDSTIVGLIEYSYKQDESKNTDGDFGSAIAVCDDSRLFWVDAGLHLTELVEKGGE